MLHYRKKILKKLAESKNYRKVRDHYHYIGKYRNATHSICNLRFNVPLVFHNGSNYDYHFIIKELLNEFEEQFECLGENTEKHKTFSIPIGKVTKFDKDGNEIVVIISYKIKFIDSVRYHVNYQVLLIVSQKEFIKLNVTIVIVFLNMKVSNNDINKFYF